MIGTKEQEYYAMDREYGVGLVIGYERNPYDQMLDLTMRCSGTVIRRRFGFQEGDIEKLESRFMSKEFAISRYPEWFV